MSNIKRLDALAGQLNNSQQGKHSIPQRYSLGDTHSIHHNSGIDDLAGERRNATFNVRELIYFLDGSPEVTAQREKIMLEFERDPTFRLDDLPDLTRPQLRERYMTRVHMCHYHHHC